MPGKTGLSRRGFAAALAGSPALLAQQPPAPAANAPRRGTEDEIPPFGESIEFARADVPSRVRPFPMRQVRLLPGPQQRAQEANRGYLGRLSAARLVHNFRTNAGLPSPAEPYGGWEEPKGELRGHFTGHFLSACALMHAATGDREVKAKGDEMVAALAECQRKLGGGYLSAFPTEFFDRLDARSRVWAPFYTVHKIMAGMLDMYRHCDNQQALEVLQGMASWADRWSAAKSQEHMQDILNTEYGGMNEVLYNLSAATGEERWARAGDRFTKKRFFNPLALRRDELRGLHVNTHVPQVIGAARRYEISGDTRFHDVADFFWYEVTSARAYVTGGTSNGEGWLARPRALAAELQRSTNTAECCCVYNMLKLTRHLYGWTGDPRYFDYYERVLFNHRLGTIRSDSGHAMYYLSHTPGAWKTFGTEEKSFWCCTGTGVEEYSKLNDSIYFQDAEGLYVNLFVPSELNWTEKGLRVPQETGFPEQPGTSLTMRAERPVQAAVRLRVPSWAASAPSVKVNGRTVDASAAPGSYLVLSRTWKTGDRIEMQVPMQLRVEAMPDDPHLQAVLYGPLVLAGDLGAAGLTPELIEGPMGPHLRDHAMEVPVFHASSADPNSWMRAADAPLTFRTTGQARDLTLVPLNGIFDRRYSIYWQVA